MRAADLVMIQTQYAHTGIYDDRFEPTKLRIPGGGILLFLEERSGEELAHFDKYSRVLLPSGRVGYVRSSMLTTVQFASVQSCEPVG